MTIAGQPPATELGLRPAPLPYPTFPAARGRIVPAALLLLALLIGLLILTGPEGDLYPVAGDSAKYHAIAMGFARLYSHPLEGLRLWLSHGATQAELARYGFDSWVLQHAPAYTAYLGVGYVFTHGSVMAGRLLTVLLFAAGAVLLYLLARMLFGPWPALGAGLLYLFWPAHWFYAPAILTEIPVATAALAASYALLRTARSRVRGGWFLGGVAIGVLILTKTTLRYLAVPWILFEALVDRGLGRGVVLRRAGWRIAGWGATQLLWFIFLWGFQLSPNPLARTGDDWLWIYRGDYVPDRGWETVGLGDAYTPELLEGAQRAESVTGPNAKGEMYKQAFLATLRGHPGGMLALMLAKAGIFWRFPTVKTYVRAGPVELPPPIRVQPALAVAALLGLALCVGAGGLRCMPAVFPIYLTLLHAATHLVSRYHVPALPFAMLYAAGAVAVLFSALRDLLRRGSRAWRSVAGTIRASRVPLAVALAAVLVAAVVVRVGGTVALLGPWLAGLGVVPLLARLLAGGRLGRIRALLFVLPLALLTSGTIANNPDPDQARVRLKHAGDGVRLHLRIPGNVQPERFISSEVLLDLLPSVRGRMTLSVRLSGKEIARFEGRPPSGPDAFLLDPEVNKADERYRRVLRSVERHIDGFVRRHHGMKEAGYDYYRQWYRVPVDPAVAIANPDLLLEIVLVETQGGTADLFLDRDAPAGGASQRWIEMPAFFENSYELSNYRFDALASDRLLADPRLIRPVAISSSRVGAERFDGAGRRWPLQGEPRIRLRAQQRGGYALVRGGRGSPEPAWLEDPAKGIRALAPQEILTLQADRDRYTGGALTF